MRVIVKVLKQKYIGRYSTTPYESLGHTNCMKNISFSSSLLIPLFEKQMRKLFPLPHLLLPLSIQNMWWIFDVFIMEKKYYTTCYDLTWLDVTQLTQCNSLWLHVTRCDLMWLDVTQLTQCNLTQLDATWLWMLSAYQFEQDG